MTEERPADETPPTQPVYTPPTSAPPPAPEPAIAWAPMPAAPPPARPAQRSTLSLAAGIVLIVLGILGVLVALALLTIGREFVKQVDFTGLPGYTGGDPTAFVTSIVTYGGIVLLVCSTFYVVGGVGTTRSKEWGRVIGIVIGILGGLIWLGSVANIGRGGPRDDVSFAVVLLALHAYVAIALLFFWRNRAPA
jgi:hypothetical protein